MACCQLAYILLSISKELRTGIHLKEYTNLVFFVNSMFFFFLKDSSIHSEGMARNSKISRPLFFWGGLRDWGSGF